MLIVQTAISESYRNEAVVTVGQDIDLLTLMILALATEDKHRFGQVCKETQRKGFVVSAIINARKFRKPVKKLFY